MATVTESLVDAKDEARQAEVRLDLSEAIRDFETSMATWARWIITTTISTVAIAVVILLNVG